MRQSAPIPQDYLSDGIEFLKGVAAINVLARHFGVDIVILILE